MPEMTREILITLDPDPVICVNGRLRKAQTTIQYEKDGGLVVEKITVKLYPEEKP
jgi:hypothetical protein